MNGKKLYEEFKRACDTDDTFDMLGTEEQQVFNTVAGRIRPNFDADAAKRLRLIADKLGLSDAIPATDSDLWGAVFAALGMIRERLDVQLDLLEFLRVERNVLQKIATRRADRLEAVGLHPDCTQEEAVAWRARVTFSAASRQPVAAPVQASDDLQQAIDAVDSCMDMTVVESEDAAAWQIVRKHIGAAPAQQGDGELPPLPEIVGSKHHMYSADQMHEYARAALAQHTQPAGLTDEQREDIKDAADLLLSEDYGNASKSLYAILAAQKEGAMKEEIAELRAALAHTQAELDEWRFTNKVEELERENVELRVKAQFANRHHSPTTPDFDLPY